MIPPHAGRDRLPAHNEAILRNFNPPAPCGAGPLIPRPVLDTVTFQSTRPLRGGTNTLRHCNGFDRFQSTRPLRGGTSAIDIPHVPTAFQSTRPLRGGTSFRPRRQPAESFQSTRPLRGGTCRRHETEVCLGISIHPPLAGRDFTQPVIRLRGVNFNPPAPCGAGRNSTPQPTYLVQFQSTRPLRGGTSTSWTSASAARISIHPPLAGRDATRRRSRRTSSNFNPPAPCGAGRSHPAFYTYPSDFNPPAPCGAGQRSCTKKLCKTSHIAQKVHLPWPY